MLLAGRTNLVIILGMMQVSKKIPFEDPQVLMAVRALYIVSNLIIIALNFYMTRVINTKRGMLPFVVRAGKMVAYSNPHL